MQNCAKQNPFATRTVGTYAGIVASWLLQQSMVLNIGRQGKQVEYQTLNETLGFARSQSSISPEQLRVARTHRIPRILEALQLILELRDARPQRQLGAPSVVDLVRALAKFPLEVDDFLLQLVDSRLGGSKICVLRFQQDTFLCQRFLHDKTSRTVELTRGRKKAPQNPFTLNFADTHGLELEL